MSRLEETPKRLHRASALEGALKNIDTGWQALREQTTVWPSSLNWLLRLGEWLLANRVALVLAVTVVASMRIGLAIVGLFAQSFIPENKIPLSVHLTSNSLIDMWVRWDAIHYLQIATSGYQPHSDNLAFFPLLPVLMRAVARLIDGNLMVAGLVISTLAFAAA
ncbi:MAG: mannosyltransferase family protein, partial [Rudaea sp.]